MSGTHHSTIGQSTELPSANAGPNGSPYILKYDTVLAEGHQTDAGQWISSTSHEALEGAKPAPKRRRPFGNDHLKHRRTRNGCYTCRSRRVKCDEVRPICERCRKGSRECTYPEPRTTNKASSGSKKDQSRTAADGSRSTSSSDAAKSPGDSRPSNFHSQGRLPSNSDAASIKETQTKNLWAQSPPLSLAELPLPSVEQVKQEGSLSPSTEASSVMVSAGLEPEKFSSVSTDASYDDRSRRLWGHLPQDIQFFLDYHKAQVTSHHYFFKHDATYFIHTTLVEHALQYEPLLHAIVGFAAFQYTVKRSDGKIQDFLGYYNNSVSLLRKSLSGGENHTDATMMTILQLATFEDYLGDWVSLLGHQKAASGMLVELYTPQTITNNEVQRKLVGWYTRFDVMSGMMSGHETVLTRDWFDSTEKYYREQSAAYPRSIDPKIEAAIAKQRLLGADMTVLFAQFARGSIAQDCFIRETNHFAEQIRTWRENLDPVFQDERYLVTSFDGREKDPEDIVDPYRPGGLYDQPLFTFNFMLIDWHSVNLVQKYKTALLLRQSPPPEVRDLALEICRIYEAIELWPRSPPGAFTKAQGGLGLAILFLPKDEKHISWCRKQLAHVETLGHIYPASFRNQMADIWDIPDLKNWWLSDETKCPPVVRNIHAFMEDRLPNTKGQPRNEDQRNIKGIFSDLSISEKSKVTPAALEGTAYTPVTLSSHEATVFASTKFFPNREDPGLDMDTTSESSMLEHTGREFP